MLFCPQFTSFVFVMQVNRDVYPVGTYSYAAQLIIVFLVTDFLR